MKKNITITPKELRYSQLKEISMSKQLLTYVVKIELVKFYTHKLTDFESYSNAEIQKLLNLLQDIAYGRYNNLINDGIPNDFPYDECYDAKIVIEDDIEGCGNLKLKVNLTPSWMKKLEI
ncbi:hypothetical protein [Metabacillus dongyingensis]|uniref:hypothetical protein n=1 Tax=Metabacillus dongyingensis TaxID=2874282 RepID=UPI001CBE5BF6|nr:hypothetical protein [Metabacillus dongyingensis]UAL54465.1 hypothetical protein K8L98_12160 [Metabacillus dongyingensis]